MRILLMLPFELKFNNECPDLGLGYLAACLKKDGHKVQIILKHRNFASPHDFSDFIRREKFDIIGIKVMTSTMYDASESIKLIRAVNQNVTIILGGPHVSADPQNIFKLIPDVNYAFHGEAEIGLTKLVNALSKNNAEDDYLSQVPNLVWRKDSQTVINKSELVFDLDMIPFPAFELMDPKTFHNMRFNGYSRRFPISPITLTRGCPNKCTYCGAPTINGHKIRSRSVENIVEEIKLLTTKFGIKEIQFFDSNCAHRYGPLREVLRRIISERIDITWCAPNGIRIDSIDKELVGLMKQSGCFQVNVGIESGSPRILKQIKKGLSLNIVRGKIKLLRDAKIEVVGFFMIGFPGETVDEISQTISFAMELPLTGFSGSILCPQPGTEIYNELNLDDHTSLDTLINHDHNHYQNNLSEVPLKQLRIMLRNAYIKFHLRPRILIHLLKNLNSIDKIKFLIHRGFTVFHQ